MSFKCHKCQEPQAARTQPKKTVILTREKVYPLRFNENTGITLDRGGKGTEIVKELDLCPNC